MPDISIIKISIYMTLYSSLQYLLLFMSYKISIRTFIKFYPLQGKNNLNKDNTNIISVWSQQANTCQKDDISPVAKFIYIKVKNKNFKFPLIIELYENVQHAIIKICFKSTKKKSTVELLSNWFIHKTIVKSYSASKKPYL